ncbi:FecR domain-containing protein [Flagellimonas sp. S3867]|uniref:FecR domain-containing protein n=1 Tax=Flagellimonas sp. S3867 TaxID=2768063 RepID=UPI001684795F|nr:FecR domain-containing protein [Flagellimonas sp. S3867]
MDKKKFLTLLDRYLKGVTTEEEEKLLLNYFNSFQNSELDGWPIELGDPQELKEKMLGRISQNIESKASHKNKLKLIRSNRFLKYAASIAILFGVLYVYFNEKESSLPAISDVETSNSIMLKLDNGNVDVISENDQKKITDSKGNVVGFQTGNTIAYEPKTTLTKELVYNELTVPLGKKFDLVLSDGTMVKLNAGSTIKYPIQFIEGASREVEVWGEAYFDVTKDENHPFLVNANNIQIKVLGTKFNVSSYPEDEDIHTVLVEGSVQLFNTDSEHAENSFVITPSQKASWDKELGEMTIKEVDTNIYTSWINGRIIFKNIPFKNIRKKLERRYNVTITNNNESLDEKFYNASFDIETIHQVMEAFRENYNIDYTITDNQIIIN